MFWTQRKMWYLVSPVSQHQKKRRRAHEREPERHRRDVSPDTCEAGERPAGLSSVRRALSVNITPRRCFTAGTGLTDGNVTLCSPQRSLLSNNNLASVTSRLRFPRSYRSGAGRVSKLPQVFRGSCLKRRAAVSDERLVPVVAWHELGFQLWYVVAMVTSEATPPIIKHLLIYKVILLLLILVLLLALFIVLHPFPVSMKSLLLLLSLLLWLLLLLIL